MTHHQLIRNYTSIILALIISLALLVSCQQQVVQEQDIDFVNSLKTTSKHQSIIALDSALQLQKYQSIRMGLLHYEKGKLLSLVDNHTQATSSFESALEIFQQYEDKQYLSKTYYQLGSENAFLGQNEIAIQQLLTALNYCMELQDKKNEANVYSSLAHVYFQYGDLMNAIEQTSKAISIQQNIQDTVGLSATYNNMAVLYRNTGDLQSALQYNIKSLHLNMLQNDQGSIAKSYNNLALVSEQLGDTENAISYYTKAAELNEELGAMNPSPLKNLASLYLNMNAPQKAQDYYLKALDIALKAKSTSMIRDIYSALLNTAIILQDFEAIRYYNQQQEVYFLHQHEQDMKEKLALVDDQYQLAAKEQELKTALQVNRRNKIIILAIVGIIILLGMFGYQSYKTKKISHQNEKLSLEQAVLRSQMNPHFIFNALSAIQNTLMDNNPMQSASYLSSFAKLIRLNFEFVNKETILLSDEILALENYLKTQQMRYKDLFTYHINISGVDANFTRIPPLLLQPFVENAIEHGFKNKDEEGILTINISSQNGAISFEIIDNGNGYPSEHKSDGKEHSIDVFMKRLQLLGNKDEKSVRITSNDQGTTVKFSIKQ